MPSVCLFCYWRICVATRPTKIEPGLFFSLGLSNLNRTQIFEPSMDSRFNPRVKVILNNFFSRPKWRCQPIKQATKQPGNQEPSQPASAPVTLHPSIRWRDLIWNYHFMLMLMWAKRYSRNKCEVIFLSYPSSQGFFYLGARSFPLESFLVR